MTWWSNQILANVDAEPMETSKASGKFTKLVGK